jgi:hypothetical protein
LGARPVFLTKVIGAVVLSAITRTHSRLKFWPFICTNYESKKVKCTVVMSQEESRWALLLQPIKQLEKNWDIDIAAELTDYLEELATLTFEVNGLCSLDFAEAAMVVHSSSCTYAKKVDHLLKLTLAALDSAKAKQANKAKNRAVSSLCIDCKCMGLIECDGCVSR